jgi:hypothetical protein
MVSGARPVSPPSAKMASMVNSFEGAAVWAERAKSEMNNPRLSRNILLT